MRPIKDGQMNLFEYSDEPEHEYEENEEDNGLDGE